MPEQIPDINVPEITPVITSFIMIFVKFIRNTAALIPNERNIARSDFIFLPIIKIILISGIKVLQQVAVAITYQLKF